MFLLERKVVAALGSTGGPIEEFAILGATGNGTGPHQTLLLSHCAAQNNGPLHLKKCKHHRAC